MILASRDSASSLPESVSVYMILASRDSASSLPESVGIDVIGPLRDTASSGHDRSVTSAAAFGLGQLLLYGIYHHGLLSNLAAYQEEPEKFYSLLFAFHMAGLDL